MLLNIRFLTELRRYFVNQHTCHTVNIDLKLKGDVQCFFKLFWHDKQSYLLTNYLKHDWSKLHNISFLPHLSMLWHRHCDTDAMTPMLWHWRLFVDTTPRESAAPCECLTMTELSAVTHRRQEATQQRQLHTLHTGPTATLEQPQRNKAGLDAAVIDTFRFHTMTTVEWFSVTQYVTTMAGVTPKPTHINGHFVLQKIQCDFLKTAWNVHHWWSQRVVVEVLSCL